MGQGCKHLMGRPRVGDSCLALRDLPSLVVFSLGTSIRKCSHRTRNAEADVYGASRRGSSSKVHLVDRVVR